MPHGRGMRRLLVLAVASILAACETPDQGEEWSRPYDGWLPGAEPEGVAAVLVIDGETGAAVPGARVLHHEESIDPLVLEPPLLGEATTDVFGLASLDVRGRPGSHWTIDAPGYAPAHSWGTDARAVYQLWRGRTVGGRLLDPAGAPLAGVPLHLFLNCSHGPVARRAVTDAGGRFSLDHVQLALPAEDLDSRDVYPQSLAVPGHLVEGGEWLDPERLAALGNGLVSLAARPSATVTGQVVDRAGRPVGGCVVRGPRRYDVARTGPDGVFRLAGLTRDRLAVFHASHENGATEWADEDFEPGFPVRVVVGDAGEEAAEELRILDIAVSDGGGTPLGGCAVRIVDLATGAVREKSTWDEPEPSGGVAPGTARFHVPDGRYAVLVGTPFSGWRGPGTGGLPGEAPPEVDVDRTPSQRFDVVLGRTQARLALVATGIPEDARVALVLPGDEVEIDLPPEESDPVFLPASGPAWIRVEAHGLARVVEIGAAIDGWRRAEVAWPAPKRIRVPAGAAGDDPDFESLDGVVFAVAEPASGDGRRELLTHASGRLRFAIPAGVDPADRLLFDVEVPEEPGAEVLVDPAMVSRAPAGGIRVLLADGTPATGSGITVANDYPPDPGRNSFSSDDPPEAEAVDAGGWLASARFRAGRRVTVHRPGHVALRRRLSGDGPWTLRFGSGVLRLQVTSPDSRPPGFVLLVDAWIVRGSNGMIDLAGFEPGLHTILVGATGFRSRELRVRIPAEGVRELQVSLTRAPPLRAAGR